MKNKGRTAQTLRQSDRVVGNAHPTKSYSPHPIPGLEGMELFL